MSDYEITKGIPLPKRGRDGKLTEALKKLEIGDSFLISAEVRIYVGTLSKRHNVKISTHKEGDQYRLWRIA